MTEPGQPCPVCGVPDPEHDWDVHDAQPSEPFDRRRLAAAGPLEVSSMYARSSTRGGHRVRVLALHTTEGIMRATDLRAWTGWKGSSHAASDAGGDLLTPDEGFVPYDRAAWTLRSGNPWSDNLEQCALAAWTRAQWLARRLLLETTAAWLAERSIARGIPLVKITPTEYRNGASGVIAHHDHTVGYSDGTHWDCGPGYPFDVVLDLARRIAAPPATVRPFPGRDTDRMMLIRLPQADGTGNEVWLLDAIGYHHVREPATRDALVKAGVPQVNISRAEHDHWLKAQQELRG